ncbi:asparagine synthase [Lutibacter oceani]|uniref:asparagine synthase (glutamine-hydrolyzing) n=1 Tax=Lutibacter oceani TaxID=1853311 RepID=A0A3D9RQC1_9FLAO|nr:asparagine synthase-related protein [Lutibacter oceani]REE81987.1 asparagine synthase [Lutibacter oceani]
MNTIKTPIIPIKKTFAKVEGSHELNLEAICVFSAIGFFLDTDTYWRDEITLAPGTKYVLDKDSYLLESKKWFQWHYSPRAISFEDALREFTKLLETIIEEQTVGKKVILPLSGGLDSRTQAVALREHPQVKSYSYAFEGGYAEDKIGKKIAEKCDFPFQSFSVKKGYLWSCIEELAVINTCYSEFTHPRQMAFIDEFKDLGNIFSLGHMGDLMFDSFGLDQLSFDEEVQVIIKMLLKKGGLELATSLWNSWGLEGIFENYFESRIRDLLKGFKIENTNAKLRAFKTQYSVVSWSSNNLAVFEKVLPITLPYYDNRMCEFICTIPEEYLANRQLQIAYIQQKAPDLAKITWQGNKPFNLTNFHLNKVPYNLPYRVTNKLKRELNSLLGKPFVSRNWELQFVGKENDKQLRKWLFESDLKELVPNVLIQQFYDNFKEKNAVKYSHPVSMLLTLALFQKKFNK